MREDVTACLVAYHEEELIRRCVESIKKVTQHIIVVHDGPCRDQTVAICKELGCQVFEREHCGMCEGHRVFAYNQVNTKWILQLDADEYLSDELIAHVDALCEDAAVACYEFSWPYWDGARYRTTDWPVKRALFQTAQFEYLAFPHEAIRPLGAIKRVPYRIEHRPAGDNYSLRSFRTKHQRWIKIHADFYLQDIHALERYPAEASHLLPHYHRIGQMPLCMAPLVFGYHLAGMLMLGGLRNGWYGIRNCLVQSAYYFMLALEVHRQKMSTLRNMTNPSREV